MRIVTIALAAIVAAHQPAAAQPRAPMDVACDRMIDALGAYRSENGWSIVTRSDLLTSDRELWGEYRDADDCPGAAKVDLDGDSNPEFAITEIRRRGDHIAQRLLLYRPSAPDGRIAQVWRTETAPFPYVVYATEERQARDFYSGDVTRFPHEAFVFERMEAWAVLYYEAEGRLRHVLVSDRMIASA